MKNKKIKKVLKEILLNRNPNEYCYEKSDGEITVTFYYKESKININHYPIYEIKKIKGLFCSREEKNKTELYCTHVHIYPYDSKIGSLYFKFDGNETSDIRLWLKKYIDRYNNNEINKKEIFLDSL
jgi:hypothetical protein